MNNRVTTDDDDDTNKHDLEKLEYLYEILKFPSWTERETHLLYVWFIEQNLHENNWPEFGCHCRT